MPRRIRLAALEQALGVQFADPALLELALTHRSVSARRNNERLEFLGDAILGQVIAQSLYERFPDAREGELSRMRASLVNGRTLAGMARQLGLPDLLHLGIGELKSGGHRRDSILADTFEAVIAAVFLGHGIDEARAMVLRLFARHLDALNPDALLKDAKSRLQEWLQARQLPPPAYSLETSFGADHNRRFVVRCTLPHAGLSFMAENSSRRKAEQDAANHALRHLEEA